GFVEAQRRRADGAHRARAVALGERASRGVDRVVGAPRAVRRGGGFETRRSAPLLNPELRESSSAAGCGFGLRTLASGLAGAHRRQAIRGGMRRETDPAPPRKRRESASAVERGQDRRPQLVGGLLLAGTLHLLDVRQPDQVLSGAVLAVVEVLLDVLQVGLGELPVEEL